MTNDKKRTEKQRKSTFNRLPIKPPKDWKAPPCQLPRWEQRPINSSEK